jgi:hypothetical protein
MLKAEGDVLSSAEILLASTTGYGETKGAMVMSSSWTKIHCMTM